MLSVNPGPLRYIPNKGLLVERRKPTDRQRRSSAISKVILRTSSELAECKSGEVEQIIHNAIATVSEIEGAEHAGWYLLPESGKLRAVFDSSSNPFSPCSMLCGELDKLSWCFAQLCAGKGVVLDSVDHLLPVAKVDWQILKTFGVRSVALLPSKSVSSGRTILVLLSMSTTREWSDRIVEQGTLLENIFANAHQRVLAQEESKTTVKRFEITKNELSKRQNEIGVLASQLLQSQENERKRISRELHDDIGQRLSLAASEVALLASQQSESTPILVNRLDALRDELDCLCSDIHEMSHDLHSYKLQHLGLKSALKDLCRKISQPGFRVDLYAEDFQEPASKDVALCLYRVAQESLKNSLKHANTSIAAVTLTKLDNTFYMTIQDSGEGFNEGMPSRGLGLLSMNERVKLVHGHFKMHSLPGRGTEIWVEIPDTRDVEEAGSMDESQGHYANSLA
jgi:signal transduction histidine kinase